MTVGDRQKGRPAQPMQSPTPCKGDLMQGFSLVPGASGFGSVLLPKPRPQAASVPERPESQVSQIPLPEISSGGDLLPRSLQDQQ